MGAEDEEKEREQDAAPSAAAAEAVVEEPKEEAHDIAEEISVSDEVEVGEEGAASPPPRTSQKKSQGQDGDPAPVKRSEGEVQDVDVEQRDSAAEAVRKTQFAPRIESVQEYHVSKVQPSNKDAVRFDADASDEEDAKQKYRKTGIVPNRGPGSKESDAAEDDPDVTFDVPDDWTEEDKVQYRKTGRVPPGRQLTSLASSSGRTSDGSAGGDRASTSSGAEKRVASALKTPGDNEQSNKANRQPRETRFAQQIATVKEIPGNEKGKAKDKKAVGFDEDKKAGDDEGTTQSMKYRKTGALLPADSRASFSSVDEDDDEEEEEGHKLSQDSRGTDDAVDGAASSARDKKKAVQIAPDADAPDVDVKKFRKTGFVKPGATPADEDSDDETSSEDEAELGAIMQGGATPSPGSQPRTRATRFAESPPSVREIAGRGQDGDDKKVGFGGDVVDDDEQKQRFRKTGIAPQRGSGSDDHGESDVSFDPAIGDNDDAKQKYRKTGFVPKGGAFDADVSFDPAIGNADHEIHEKYRKTGVPRKRKPGLVEQEEDDDEDTPKDVSFDPAVDNATGTREKFRKTGFPGKQGKTKKDDETSPSEDDDEVDEDVGDTSPAGDAPSRTKAKPKSQVNFPEDQTAGAKSEDQPGKLYRRTAMPTTDRDSRMSDDSAAGSRAAGSDSGAAFVMKSDSSGSAAPSTGTGTDDANSGEKLITGVVLSELDEAVQLDSADAPGPKKRGVGFADMDDDDESNKATLRKTAFPKPKTFSKAGSSNKAVGFGGVSVKPVSVFDEDSRMTEQASLRIGSSDLAGGASAPETTNKASEEEAGLAQIEANPFEVPLHKQEDEHDKGKLLLDLIHEELANDGENTGGKSKSKGKDDKEGDEDSYEAYLKRRHEANKEYYGEVEDVGVVDHEHTSVRLSLLDDAGTPELGSADEETIGKAEAAGTALATTAHTKYSRDYTPLPDIPDGKPEYDPNAFPELQDMDVEFYKRQSYFRDVNVDALHGEDSYGERRSHLEELGEHIATMHRQTGTGHVPIKIVTNAMNALSSYFGFGGGSAAADVDASSADKVNSSAAVVQISGPRSDAAREMLVNRVLADAEHDMDSSASPPSASTAPNAGVPLWAAPVLMPSQQSPGSRSRSLGPGNKRPSSSSGKWSWPDPRGQSTLMMGLQMKARPDPQAPFRASWNWPDPRGQSTLREYGTAWSGWPDRTSSALRDSQAVRASWNWPDPRGRSTLRDVEQRGSVSSSDPSSGGGGPSSPSPTDSPPTSRGFGLKAATFYEPARSRLGSFSEVMGASNINGASLGGGEHLMSGEHRGYSTNVLMEQAEIGGKASFSSGETSQIRKALEDSLLVMEKQGERLEEKLEACADDLKVELVENTAVLKQSLAIEAGALAERLAADVSERQQGAKSGDAPEMHQKMRGRSASVGSGSSSSRGVNTAAIKRGSASTNSANAVPTVSQILRDASEAQMRMSQLAERTSERSSLEYQDAEAGTGPDAAVSSAAVQEMKNPVQEVSPPAAPTSMTNENDAAPVPGRSDSDAAASRRDASSKRSEMNKSAKMALLEQQQKESTSTVRDQTRRTSGSSGSGEDADAHLDFLNAYLNRAGKMNKARARAQSAQSRGGFNSGFSTAGSTRSRAREGEALSNRMAARDQIARDEINGQLSLITEGLDPDDPAVAQMEERVASLQRQIAETKKQDRKREANFVLDSLRRDARRLNGKVNVDVNVLNRTSRGVSIGSNGAGGGIAVQHANGRVSVHRPSASSSGGASFRK